MFRYRLFEALARVKNEYNDATNSHGSMHSAHEGFSVIHEEFDELKAEVWKKNRSKEDMAEEATQLAAMAIRFLVDVCGDSK